jgi:hypothetical protein
VERKTRERKWLKIRSGNTAGLETNGHPTCIRWCVGRVRTRSASSGEWGGRGPFAGWHGSFPPASEREARMDDPMIRSRLGRINRNATRGLWIPSRSPLLYFRQKSPGLHNADVGVLLSSEEIRDCAVANALVPYRNWRIVDRNKKLLVGFAQKLAVR